MTAKPWGKPCFLFPSWIAFAFPTKVLAEDPVFPSQTFPQLHRSLLSMSRQFRSSFKFFFEKFIWGLCSNLGPIFSK